MTSRSSILHRSSTISTRTEPKSDQELIATLRQENTQLKTEWETCEGLLAGSQGDNRVKHNMIESQKQYIKELERLLELSLGPDWKLDHDISSPLSHSVAACTPSTPLPKPRASLRHSVAGIGPRDRASRILGGTSVVHALEKLNEMEEVETTPSAALRQLEGRKQVALGKASIVNGLEEARGTPQVHEPTLQSPPALIDVRAVAEMLEAMETRARARESRITGLVQEAREVLVAS